MSASDKDTKVVKAETIPGLGEGCTFSAKRREAASIDYHTTELVYSITVPCSLENLMNGTAEALVMGILHGKEFEQNYLSQYSDLLELVGRGSS